ncbi:hypothetical protein EFT49_00600 [Leuconostoc falkenbergense]|uniref:hypothetical protein n=1 Tax=Leuconostoc falkenbergense TaxID=2766470 RepID=UPI0021A9A6C2|nr:hypothetical protein [Leuconostoc falkenbergense]MCT4418739.1 hypothetical protein [Leuconostoc falkenbergense]
MAVKVTFVNNDSVYITDDTYISAWKSVDTSDEEPGYYSEGGRVGSRLDGNLLGTSDPIVALEGLFGSVDWFMLLDDKQPVPKVYKTSAILSLESINI